MGMLQQIEKSTMVIHHENDEYEVMICCVDSGRTFNIQISSCKIEIDYTARKKDDMTLEEFIQMVAACGKKQIINMTLFERHDLMEKYGESRVRN